MCRGDDFDQIVIEEFGQLGYSMADDVVEQLSR